MIIPRRSKSNDVRVVPRSTQRLKTHQGAGLVRCVLAGLAVLLPVVGNGRAYGYDPMDYPALPPTVLTGTVTFSGGLISGHPELQAVSGAADADVFVFESLEITGDIFVLGNKPLVLLSQSDMLIDTGEIDLRPQPTGGFPPLAPVAGGYGGGIDLRVSSGAPRYALTHGDGPGGGYGGSFGAGAGHGGAGGEGLNFSATAVNPGGVAYGDILTALQGGSGGGAGVSRGIAGGHGGGAIEFGALGTLTFNAGVVADGGDAERSAGGGAGGSVLLHGGSVDITSGLDPRLTAKGGNVPIEGGAGAGGRIAILNYDGVVSGSERTGTYVLGDPQSALIDVSGGGGGSVAENGGAGVVTIGARTVVVDGHDVTVRDTPYGAAVGPVPATDGSGVMTEAVIHDSLELRGGRVTLSGDDHLPTTGQVSVNGGTFDLAGFNQTTHTLDGFAGGVDVGAGHLHTTFRASLGDVDLTGGRITSDGSVTFSNTLINVHSSPIGAVIQGTGASGLDLGGAAPTFDVEQGTAVVDLTLDGQLVNGSFIKAGEGVMRIEGTANLSTLTSVKLGEGVLEFANTTTSLTGPTLDLGGGTLRTEAAFAGTSSPAVLTTNDNIMEAIGDFTFAGGMSGTGGLTKTGPGTLTFSAASNYTGPTMIEQGNLTVTGTMGSGNTITIKPGARLSLSNGSVSRSVHGQGTSSIISASGTSTVGSTGSFTGFIHEGAISLSPDASLTLHSAVFAQLGAVTSLNRATLNASNGIVVGAGDALVASSLGASAVNARVVAVAGSTIQAFSDLTIGSASSSDGFLSDGVLDTRDNTVTLLDANLAGLGSLTTLGIASSPGTLVAANGLALDFTDTLQGFGTVDTPDNPTKPVINNGAIVGNSTAEPVTLNGYVKGVGTFVNAVFAGTFSPGLSPAAVRAEGLAFGPDSSLVAEIGGTTPGSQHDQVNVTGGVTLGGVLDIQLIDGFLPEIGDEVVVMTYGSRGETFFDSVRGAVINTGLSFAPLYGDTDLVLRATAPGDINGDDEVSVEDLATFALHFGTSPGPGSLAKGDINGDGDVTVADLALLASNFGFVLGISDASGLSLDAAVAIMGIDPATVPEPSAGMLLAVGAVGGLFRGRRHPAAVRGV